MLPGKIFHNAGEILKALGNLWKHLYYRILDRLRWLFVLFMVSICIYSLFLMLLIFFGSETGAKDIFSFYTSIHKNFYLNLADTLDKYTWKTILIMVVSVLIIVILFGRKILRWLNQLLYITGGTTFLYHLSFFTLLIIMGGFNFIATFDESINSNFSSALFNPFLVAGVTGFFTIAFNVIARKNELLINKKQKDISIYIHSARLKDHRILCGFGQIGQQVLNEMIKYKECPKAKLYWESKVYIARQIVVIEKQEGKIPYAVGEHPVTGKIGYAKLRIKKKATDYSYSNRRHHSKTHTKYNCLFRC